MVLNFAYGSNLDWCQMRHRCPSAKFICRALLENHILDFPRKSRKRCGGVADAKGHDGHGVWGVVYEIHPDDVSNLNKCEGYDPNRADANNAYNPIPITVLSEGKTGEPLQVTIYKAVPKVPGLPSAAYMELIIAGAAFWQLPEEYVRELEAIKVAP
jgi:hypothetical protein